MEDSEALFAAQKNFSKNYPHFGHMPSEKVHQPCPRPQMFKISVWRGARFLACPECPHVLGRPCVLSNAHRSWEFLVI